jgi:hypothetical protein
MKYFVLLLSLYFAVLAFLPCQDRDDTTAEKVYTVIQNNHSSDNQKHQDNCPPFCSCYCCSTARQISSVLQTVVFSKTLIRKYAGYAAFPTLEQPIKIWQPPQLA